MKKLILAFCILITLSCCDKKEESLPHCEFATPLEDLGWLKEYKKNLNNCTVQISIFQAEYKNGTVFYSAITDPLANSVFGVTLWDCEGNEVRVFQPGEQDEFSKEVTNREVLYRCK